MRPILVSFGSVHVYAYHFMLFVGCMMGLWYVTAYIDNRKIDGSKLFPLFLYIFIAAIAGARLFNCVVFWEYYRDNPWSLLRFWEGGMVYYGGILGAAVVFLAYVPLNGLKYGFVADLIAPAVPLSLLFGRMGCLLVGCCYGRSAGDKHPWTITFDQGIGSTGTPLYPTQMTGALFAFFTFLFLHWFKDRKRFDGQVALALLLLYSIARFTIEFYRNDPRGFLEIAGYPLSESQVVSIPLFLVALVLYLRSSLLAERRQALKEAAA
ncbi:MAG: prolipoprotein diacylglyceryl transferase [Candidatus Methylomirabilis sp.]|nr:prolipoprotein diacylglyceryl transferase [Deltaproteobacteria bacterium]